MVESRIVSSGTLLGGIQGWVEAHPRWMLALAVVVLLAPFLAKPFNMDDPLFIWTARQIQAHPLNPYGFMLNWYGTDAPMWNVTQNPPLACYYMAAAGSVLGWDEIALHTAFLLPAIAVVLGTYRLARRFCERPLLAALATLFTPVFLVSSTTVMCDVLMLAFWVWAVVWWVEGIERDDFWLLAGAGVLAALASVTKYFGVCLVPLLAVYGWVNKRRVGLWMTSLIIPALALCAYQWATRTLYHHALVSDAVHYSGEIKGMMGGTQAVAILNTFTFAGGCLACVVFFAPWFWTPRALSVMAAVAGMLFFSQGALLKDYGWMTRPAHLWLEAQIIFWTFGGVLVAVLAAEDWWRQRNPGAWLLGLWVAGTFIFTGFFNWTVNGRSLLPMAPAVGILLARRFQTQAARKKAASPGLNRLLIPLGASAALSFLVAQADYLLASTVQDSALELREQYGQGAQTMWFEGHWGFQYYMEALGGRAYPMDPSVLQPGDTVSVPHNNSNLKYLNLPFVNYKFEGPEYLACMNLNVGAGFYSTVGGPLPFAFGRVPAERVMVYQASGQTAPPPGPGKK